MGRREIMLTALERYCDDMRAKRLRLLRIGIERPDNAPMLPDGGGGPEADDMPRQRTSRV